MPNELKMINKKRNLIQYSEHIIDIMLPFFIYKTNINFCLAVKTKIYSFLFRTLFFARLVLYTLSIWIKATSLIFQCQWQLSSKQLGRSVLRRAMHRYLNSDELQNAVWLRTVWSTRPNMGPPRSGRKSLFCSFFYYIGLCL